METQHPFQRRRLDHRNSTSTDETANAPSPTSTHVYQPPAHPSAVAHHAQAAHAHSHAHSAHTAPHTHSAAAYQAQSTHDLGPPPSAARSQRGDKNYSSSSPHHHQHQSPHPHHHHYTHNPPQPPPHTLDTSSRAEYQHHYPQQQQHHYHHHPHHQPHPLHRSSVADEHDYDYDYVSETDHRRSGAAPSNNNTNSAGAEPSSSSVHARDFVHAGPPPLRRLSAPSAPVADNSDGTSGGLTRDPADPESSSSTRSRAYLPPPRLAQRSHAPPPAISIPPIGGSSHLSRAAYEAPQSAPLVPPAHSAAPFRHHLQPARSAGRPSSPGQYSSSSTSILRPPLSASAVPGRRESLLAPPYPTSASNSATGSPLPLDNHRSLRSPHPPLTALYPRQPWPPFPPTLEADEYQRPYLSSPLGDVPPSSATYNKNSAGPQSSLYSSSQHQSQPHQQQQHPLAQEYSHRQSALPASPAYLSAPPLFPAPRGHTRSHTRGNSPLHIPPPLRFKYSASPPPSSAPRPYGDDNMPPRKKATAASGGGTVTSTPNTVSSTRSSRRGAGSSTIPSKGNGWTAEHTYDSLGQPKEVIVIQDSTSPVPKKRTRAAVAAAAAAAADKYNANGSVPNGSAAKKRKIEEEEQPKRAKPKPVPAPPVPAAPPKQPAAQQQAAAAPTHPAWDDAEGHYIVKPDDVIGGRYKIVRLLGQGTFGKVVEARHIESRKKVAIKVIRAVQKYRDASKIEIRVLETLKKNDPANAHKCIHLTEYFDFRNHPCLVSELYGMSVFDFLKLNGFQPFPEKHIQDFARSLLQSVQFLHRLKLVHTDLKPENILLVSNESRLSGPRRANARSKSILRNTDIRLIDFGSATFENEYHSSVVSTRHYRAPEIILGLPWSYPCDMFSIGCILVEFFTGDALFQTHDNLEHLAMMEVVMGKIPIRMVERGKLKKPEFFKGLRVDFPNPTVSKSSRKFVKGLKSLKDIIPATNPGNALFLDLIVRLLDFDPETRITVGEALKHPYLRHPMADPPP